MPELRTRSRAQAFLTAPYFSAMPAGGAARTRPMRGRACAVATLSQMKTAHGAGCACCVGKSDAQQQARQNGAKSFPGARPG